MIFLGIRRMTLNPMLVVLIWVNLSIPYITVLISELGILYSSDQPYKPDRLWSHFAADKCPSLAGKPKLFFIQACQGDQLDHGVKMVTTESDASAGTTTYKIPSHADFLIAYRYHLSLQGSCQLILVPTRYSFC